MHNTGLSTITTDDYESDGKEILLDEFKQVVMNAVDLLAAIKYIFDGVEVPVSWKIKQPYLNNNNNKEPETNMTNNTMIMEQIPTTTTPIIPTLIIWKLKTTTTEKQPLVRGDLYNILDNLNELKSDITLAQLLDIAPIVRK